MSGDDGAFEASFARCRAVKAVGVAASGASSSLTRPRTPAPRSVEAGESLARPPPLAFVAVLAEDDDGVAAPEPEGAGDADADERVLPTRPRALLAPLADVLPRFVRAGIAAVGATLLVDATGALVTTVSSGSGAGVSGLCTTFTRFGTELSCDEI